MLLAIVYIMPWILLALLAVPKLIELRRQLKNAEDKEKQEEIKNDLREKYKKSSKFNVPISDLRKIKPILISQIWMIVEGISFIFMLPIALLRMCLMLRWGSKITWSLPVSFYEVWQLLFLTLSYYYSYQKSSILGIVIAAIVGISALHNILSELEKENGSLKILQYPIHKLNLRGIIESGIILVLTFAALFYALSTQQTNSFSSKLSILDSIYFSVITVATVGYGDINPIDTYSKILVIVEIFLGLLYMLFIVSVFLSVFLKRHIEEIESQKQEDSST